MICVTCGLDLDESDFYHSNNCYKCAYAIKIEELKRLGKYVNENPLKIKKVYTCKTCNKVLSKRGAKYCSDECRSRAKKHYLHNSFARCLPIAAPSRRAPSKWQTD